jgi:thiol-disulfide isomerase/thioredoxin
MTGFHHWKLTATIAGAFLVGVLGGAFGWMNQFVIVGLAYLGAGYLISKSHAAKASFFRSLLLVLPWMIVYGGAAIAGGMRHAYPLVVLPLIAAPVGASLRVYLAGRRVILGATVVALSGAIVAGGLIGMPNWLHHVFGFGTVRFAAPQFEFRTAYGQAVSNATLEGKVVVLDFWTTSCVICFRTFPVLDRMAAAYRLDPSIRIFAVNLPLPGESAGKARERLAKYPYRFENLYSSEPFDRVAESFGFHGVPTVVVIDREGIVRYRGSLDPGRLIFVDTIGRHVRRALEQE